jgi:hypothetical protein
MNRKTLFWHIGGIFFGILFGSFLHFSYELSGGLRAVALISAVNESTWEHLKIGFWSAFIFGIFEYLNYGRGVRNFFIAKASTLLIIPVAIILFFYGYTILIEHNLFLDISIFILAIILGYTASYKTLISNKDLSRCEKYAKMAIAILVLVFALFSYLPLHNFLFEDPISGGYGIIK